MMLAATITAARVAVGNAEVLASFSVPPGYTVSHAASSKLTAYPMFMAFDDRGRLFIAESSGKDLSGKEMAAEPECMILRLDDVDGDGVYDRRTVFADSLSLPMGVLWHRDALYVSSPPDLVRFEDRDDDGVADTREVLLSGWNVLNTASLHGPFLGPDGWLYLTHGRHGYSIETKEGPMLEGLAARIWRCRPDGTGLERYCGGGFDNPVELIFTNAGSMIGTMTYFTDPRHGQRDALMHWVYGGVYPKPHDSVSEFLRTGALMPTMTKFARIAPSGLLQYRGDGLGDAYEGALFSAQFNPHRVMSHRLIPDGATFRTEDANFLTSSYSDFYPTDVLQDADGSLLVSDTGAWYVDACPISRVAKPEVQGGIYRIRKNDYLAPDDPWGIQIDWQNFSNDEMVVLLEDPRLYVRDQAYQRLAQADDSTESLRALITKSGSVESRALALRAVVQSDGQDAADTLIRALDNDAADVRLAAIRSLANTHADSAIPQLQRVLAAGSAHERSVAASALGRIGAKGATPDLLAAADRAEDRFEEHAIIFALIELDDTETLVGGLNSASLRTRKAALIALDQLEYSELRSDHALALMESEDDALRDAGLWVASHHSDWANDITGFVSDRLEHARLSNAERANLQSIVGAYAQAEPMQLAVADLAADDMIDDERRLFLFDLLDSDTGPLPEVWQDVIGTALESDSLPIRARAIGAVQHRAVAMFDPRLELIFGNPSEPDSIRMAALDALVARRPALSPDELTLITGALTRDGDAALRSRAARILSKADLTRADELRLAGDIIPTADALVMSGILVRFEGRDDPALGRALIAALNAHPAVDRLLTGAQADRLFAHYPEAIRFESAPLRDRLHSRDDRLVSRLLDVEERIGEGDVGRGRRIFFGDRAACSTCHAIGDDGGNLGPDLTTIGLVRSRHDLLEAILFPSASMVPDYTPFLVETVDDVHAGIIERDLPETLSLRMGADEVRIIDRNDVVSIEPSPVSIMPEGLDAELADEELIDLIAFLQSLNTEQWLLPEQRNAGD
jgi:putative membrane-bound dehydrogenase-like protein